MNKLEEIQLARVGSGVLGSESIPSSHFDFLLRAVEQFAEYLHIESELPMRYETAAAAQQSSDAWLAIDTEIRELVDKS